MKPITEFYLHSQMKDGHINVCKTCCCKMAHLNPNRIKNDKRRGQNPKRKAYKTIRCQITRKKYPDRYKAHTKVNHAIRRGRLRRQACEVCNETAIAHHEDYSKPLDVRWLCQKHHLEYHSQDEPLDEFIKKKIMKAA